MNDIVQTIGAGQSAAADAMVTSLYGGLDELIGALDQLDWLTTICGNVKGTLGINGEKVPSIWEALTDAQQERLPDWYRLRMLVGHHLLPRAKALSSALLASAFAIEDLSKNCSRTPLPVQAARAAALASTQRVFNERKVDKVLSSAQRWFEDSLALDALAAQAFVRSLGVIGKPESDTFMAPRLMPVFSVVPLELQFLNPSDTAGSGEFALAQLCFEMTDSVRRIEDDLQDLTVIHGRSLFKFTRRTSRRSPPVLHAARFPELHTQVKEWAAWSADAMAKLKSAIEAALPELDINALPRTIGSAHNLLGAQVMFNHLCTLKDVSMLKTVQSDGAFAQFILTTRHSFAAWRLERDTKEPRPQSATVRLMKVDGEEVEVDPRTIESITEKVGSIWVLVIGDSRKDWLNFETTTPIDVVREAFLKSGLFVDVLVASEIRHVNPLEEETRMLLNITQICDLQMFDHGKAWLTLRQGGDPNGIVLDEKQLDNLVRRAGLVMNGSEPASDGYPGYRLFTAQGFKDDELRAETDEEGGDDA